MKTIAWDVDDVLNNLTFEWFNREWLGSYPDCRRKYEELTENPPNRLLDVDIDIYLQSLDKFRKTDGANLIPNPVVLDWFNEYGNKFRHIALSAVPLNCANISAEWTLRHFGKWIRSFNFVPSLRKEITHTAYDSTKTDYLKWIGSIDIFIDDNEKNFSGIEALGINGYLVRKPWNSSNFHIVDILEILKTFSKDDQW